MNSSDLVMVGHYNYGLVALSILIAMMGSYATIELAARVMATQGGSRLSWRIGGATAMAIGTWAMHYTGMLAFRLPVPIRYDWRTSLLSFLPSLLASAVALIVVIRPKMESPRAFVASVFIGGGIAGLHYTAMASMRFQGMDRYSPALVGLSVLLAMIFSLLSIWLTFLFRDGPRGWKLRKVGSVALLGTAIWMMHYTGMASAGYFESAIPPDFSHTVLISELSAAGIGAVALMVLGVALLTSLVERLQRQKEMFQKIFDHIPAMITFSDKGGIKLVNQEWERKRGWSLKDAQEIGPDILARLYTDPKEEQRSRDFVAAASGEWSDFRTIDSDGKVMDTAWAVVRLSDGTSLSIGQDVTERRRMEESLKATSEQLRALSASLEAAREEEAKRIAREVHDELGSALSSLRWELEDIDEVISGTTDLAHLPVLRQKVEGLLRLTDSTISVVRRISSELRPIALDELGLIEAIEWHAQQFQARTGIICRREYAVGEVHFKQDQSSAIFRIFQEAMTNILRHAQATSVDINIREEAGEFVLTISDNGRGITENEIAGAQTLGLLGLHERAHLIGGKISVVGGQGTTVTLRIPIPSR
jgi:PAS domain S-box-containing protein